MKYLFIDGDNLFAATFFATQKDSEKEHVEIEMLNAVVSHMNRVRPDRMSICWDAGECFRLALYPPYKAKRPCKPPGYKRNRVSSINLLDRAKFHNEWCPGNEADDVIASLCAKIGPDDEAIVLSSDKDFTQLVSRKISFHRRTWSKKDGSGLEIMEGDASVWRLMGVTPAWVTTLKAIVSDASDNLPGAKGVGKYRAIPLVDRFGSLENIYLNLEAHRSDFAPPTYRHMIRDRDMVFLQRDLVTMRTDAQVILPPIKLPPPGVISKAIKEWSESEIPDTR